VLFLAVIESSFYYYRSTIPMFLFLITAICPHSFHVIDKLKYVSWQGLDKPSVWFIRYVNVGKFFAIYYSISIWI